MKRIIIPLLTVSILVIFYFLYANSKNKDFTVMTFNIRYDNPGDGINAWPNRAPLIDSLLILKKPDILGTQEVLKHQFDAIANMLPNYTAIGVGRDDGKEAGEYNALFINNERFIVLQSNTFSLSETPDVIGVKGWDAVCCRIMTWALLKDKKTNKTLLACNTHLDHRGIFARRNSIKLIKNKIKLILQDNDMEDIPVEITGDFNCTESDEPYLLLTADNYYQSSYKLTKEHKGTQWTFHGFGSVPLDERKKIDYVFVNNNIKIESYESIKGGPNERGIYLSDHNPVLVNIKLISKN